MAFKQATVNSSRVAATLANFPSYLALDRAGITTLAEAQSSRIYADSGKVVEWAREVVSATEGHTKIPSITTTTSVFVDYDGVRADYAATDTYGRNAVWSDYRAVYHMNTLTTDYTGNGYTTTNTNSVGTTTGILGGSAGVAADFSTSGSKRLNLASNLGITTGPRTIQAWVKLNTAITSASWTILGIDNQGSPFTRSNLIYEYNGGTPRLAIWYWSSGASAVGYHTQTLSTSAWEMLHLTGTASSAVKLYSGGVERASVATGAASSGALPANRFEIASLEAGQFFLGVEDEVRIRASILSPDWITTEYNNQSDEPGFWGTWSDVAGPVQRGAALAFF